MSGACDRHPEGVIMQPSEMVEAFGPTAGKLVPRYPGLSRLEREGSEKSVYLSRLHCGHFLVSSPVLAAAQEQKVRESTPLEFARLTYQVLLEKAHDGEEVSPAEVASAQAAILVEEQAEAGRKGRQEAARAKAEQEFRECAEGPVRDELAESRTNVQMARDNAFVALMALLDAVDEDLDAHNRGRAALAAAGYRPDDLRTVNGYVQATVVGKDRFPYFPKAEHLIAVLHAVQYSRHRNSFTSINGRELGKHLPVPIEGGPRVSPDIAQSG